MTDVLQGHFELHFGDCIEWLKTIEDESVDLVLTDPAYESLEKHRAIGTTTRLTAEWFPIFPNTRMVELLTELYRVLKDDTHCYIYCDQDTRDVLRALMFEWAGDAEGFVRTKRSAEHYPFTWWKHLTWSKSKKGSDDPAAGMGYHYRAAQECIVFLEKGKRKLNDLGICDVLPAPRVKGYPTEKPVSIAKILIEQSTTPGQLVIDPFNGSGSTLDAATSIGRHAAACDIFPRSIEVTTARLAGRTSSRVLMARRPPSQGSLFG